MWREGWEADSLWVPQDSRSLRPFIPFHESPCSLSQPQLPYSGLPKDRSENRWAGLSMACCHVE